MTNYEKLQAVLREIFEMDKADLDFGIYRIINQKRKEINEFIDNRLPKEIREILSQTLSKDTVGLQKELDEMGKALDAADVVRESSPKYLILKKQIESAADPNALEQEIFSHLAAFFKRYYKDGDFISLRRYKKDVYAIPYEGEEVKLHWANHDQYYIKTSEYLKNYAFKTPTGKMVHFQLKEANTEQNNNKTQGDEERRFAIYKELPLEQKDNDLYINFTYEPHKKSAKQKDLEKEAVKVLAEHIPLDFADIFKVGSAPTEKNKNRTLLEKHLNDFISRNTFDYFIHKDLGGFLNRELDFYIKNEVLYIDDIDTENPDLFLARLSQIKALKTVGKKIISFVAQLEDFQKKLWLKKKFVIRTDYCITLDRVPQEYYPEIFENKDQLAEWERLYDVSIEKEKELLEEPFLMLDTQFFSEEFKDQLLAEFDDLDAQTDGLLINSENFQALNLLQEKYREKVDTVYVDPPYNTDASEIAYKNNYKNSSWLGLMKNRISAAYFLLNEKSITCVTIDDLELRNLNSLLHQTYGSNNHQATVVIRNNPSGRSTVKGFSINHEYGMFYSKNPELITLGRLPHSKQQTERYDEKDEDGNYYEWENFRKNGTDSDKNDRPKQYYPFFYDWKLKILRIPIMEYSENKKRWIIQEEKGIHEIEIYPIDDKGYEKVWKFGEERTRLNVNDFLVKEVNNNYSIYRKKFLNMEGSLPRTWWEDSKFSARDRGTRDIRNLFGKSTAFDFPKSVYAVSDSIRIGGHDKGLILDYFAGSGTTGHATIKLNREDSGSRKYILVEMGTYFDTVTKPRIQKVVYSDNWKDGKPQDKEGISQMFKYQVLESYEDVLNNLNLVAKDVKELGFEDRAQEDYLLKYMLDIESKEHLFDLEIFKNPFNYQLKVTENNELIPTQVDLVETFNYLIGLYVYRIQKVGDIKLVEGTTREGEKTLVIWRNTETVSNEEVQKVFRRLYDSQFTHEFDQIYINGDHNFQNFRKGEDRFKVKLIEEDFFKRMFDV